MKTETIYFEKLGFEITYYIGINSADNFDVIDMGGPNDIWFHIERLSSSHVVMILPELKHKIKSKIYNTILKQGALFCKQNTKKAVSMQNVNITYTKLKNVLKTTRPGSVITQNTETITI
jgi:predicted ribosome quality control (RQC) complex YloA/Tae2 family protein